MKITSGFVPVAEVRDSESKVCSMDTGLPLATVGDSMRLRPERLVARSSRFYEIEADSVRVDSWLGEALTPEQLKDAYLKMVEWVDEIWLNSESGWGISESAYAEFRKSVEALLE